MITRVSLQTTSPNKGKEETLSSFFDASKTFVERLVSDLWFNGYNDYRPSKKHFRAPKFLDSSYLEKFNDDLGLGGMIRQSLGITALGKVTAESEKLRRKQYVIGKIQSKKDKGETLSDRDKKTCHKFSKELNALTKEVPRVSSFVINLSRPDVVKTFKENKEGKEFSKGTTVVKLSLAGDFGTVAVPVEHSKQSKKLESKGFTRKPSSIALYSSKKVGLIYQREKAPKKKEGRVTGADQGISTVLTMSDAQVTKENAHGQTLNDILKKISRCKKGSKGTRRAQEHRKNFINWSINQLNFRDTKTLRLEGLKNVGKGQRKSKFLSSWTYALIKEKLIRLSELEGFEIEETSNKFRSQRCNPCGFVSKANRKGKAFECRKCGHVADADFNSSLNQELDLPRVPNWVFEGKLNRTGFFWTEEGVFTEEPVIPQNERNLECNILQQKS